MTITSRFYETGDLTRIQNLVAEGAARTNRCGYLHHGDVPHHFYNALKDFDPSELVRLWEDESGCLLGWAIVYPRSKSFNVQMHPDHRGGELENELLIWAENTTVEWMKKLDLSGEMESDVCGCDTVRSELLKQRGFSAPQHPVYVHTERSLFDPIPEPVLPEGFSIRSAAGEHEAGALAEVHAGSFKSSWTAEKYLKLMRSPGYDVEREMVVVAPDGRFAAFCIYWLDMLNKTVLFEPVGTHEEFQRRGLARALMYHVMHKVKIQGIETAIVLHETDNVASTNLYANAGFKPVHEIYFYTKKF